MDISIQLSMPLWISIWISLDFYGYPCIDLLWILDPGRFGGKDHNDAAEFYCGIGAVSMLLCKLQL